MQFWRFRVSVLARVCAVPMLISLFLLSCSGPESEGANAGSPFDWPQFLGPTADGKSAETGLRRDWPEDGPVVVWRQPVGTGYAGMSVSSGTLFTMEADSTSEYLLAMDAESGERLWQQEIGPRFKNSYGDGPRMTPTVAEGRVYALGAEGMLLAVEAGSGSLVWSLDLKDEFGFEPPRYWWGFAVSPRIDGDALLLQVAGRARGTLVALHKDDGRTLWTSFDDLAAYSTPTAIDYLGVRQYVFATGLNVVSVAADDGRLLWRYPWGGHFIRIATPVFIPPDKIFASASYGVGAVLLQMHTRDNRFDVREVWKSNVMENHFQTSILLGEQLYGFDNGTLKCIDAETGSVRWAQRRLGKGSLIYADGLLIVLSDRGKLVIAEADPDKFEPLVSKQVLDGRSWTPPVLANGVLYLRNQQEIVAMPLKQGAARTSEVTP